MVLRCLFSGTLPLKNFRDISSLFANTEVLSNRYLVVFAALNQLRVFSHVVYGPVCPEDRPAFFSSLPRHVDDSAVY